MTGWIEQDAQSENLTITSLDGEGNSCPACGFRNPLRETLCLACAGPVEVQKAQSRCGQIDAQVKRVRAGAVAPEEFRGWLEDLSAKMAEKSRAIVDYIHAQSYRDDSPDEVANGMAGIEAFEAGLSDLWQYTFDLESDRLDRGIRQVWEGNDLILEAMRLNRETRETTSLAWERIEERIAEARCA